jgi:hypothetical protein
MIIVVMIILFINAFTLFTEIRRDISYQSRTYGLSVLNEYFDQGNYYSIYEKTIENKYSDQKPEIDVSQYAAFGQYYHSWVMARTHEDNAKYLSQMKEAKKQITWKKILDVIETLEKDLP